jgi:YHS domain-containing protein
MTSARRQGKSGLAPILRRLAVLMMVIASAYPSGAAVTERIVTDVHTGLAMDGYDPVGYFTDAAPIVGRPEYEYRYRGAIWRFENQGNLAAFADSSEQYVPRFGGYDPTAIARGVAVPGNPAYWMIVGDRLYLFYSSESLASFKADIPTAIAAAEAKWPQVMERLTQ